jgi:hypothetical protein
MALSVRIAAQKLAGARLHGLDIAVSLAGPIVTLMECDAPADVIERAFRLAAELPGDLLQDQWTAGKIARVLESDGRALVTLLLNRNTSSQRSAVSRQRGG